MVLLFKFDGVADFLVFVLDQLVVPVAIGVIPGQDIDCLVRMVMVSEPLGFPANQQSSYRHHLKAEISCATLTRGLSGMKKRRTSTANGAQI